MSEVGRQVRAELEQIFGDCGAVQWGYTAIRQSVPVAVIAFPYSDTWFFTRPLTLTKWLSDVAQRSHQALARSTQLLRQAGYTANGKSVLSLYGDFRPLAVSAGLGHWGHNGLVVNSQYGSGLLFAALFTDAPIQLDSSPSEPDARTSSAACRTCGQCTAACPADAFRSGQLNQISCLRYSTRGCSECVRVCMGHHRSQPH